MARAVYPHELGDPDYNWLLSSFREKNPHFLVVEISTLPLVIIPGMTLAADIDQGLTNPATPGFLEDEPEDFEDSVS